jgi:hypothetical protein
MIKNTCMSAAEAEKFFAIEPYYRKNKDKGSFVSLPLPVTREEIKHQLFEVIHRFEFDDQDEIYISYISQGNFRLFFNNYGFQEGTTFVSIYSYPDFTTRDSDEFSQEIYEEILKIQNEEAQNEQGN